MFTAGCEQSIKLIDITGVWGSTVRMNTKRRPNSAAVIAGRALNSPKDIAMTFAVIREPCCDCGECVTPHEVTGAFQALEKGSATFTYTDTKGVPYRFTGRPLGASVIEENINYVFVRALFLATDPVGYGPLHCETITYPNTAGRVWTPRNCGNTDACWWAEIDGNVTGPITFAVFRNPQLGEPAIVADLPDKDSKRQLPKLAKGANRVTLVSSETGIFEITYCYREAWL